MRADIPQLNPDDSDRLGYKVLAKQLASVIRSVDADNGFVIAIHGAWGSGKSTLLNYAKFYLKGEIEAGRILPINFNPWWFTDAETIRQAFLKAIEGAINKGFRTSKASKLAVQTIGTLMKGASVSSTYASTNTENLGGAMLSWYFDPERQKSAIASGLKSCGKRLLVFVDDIDRLQPDEISMLFRTLKAVAELPNIVYVLAFERSYVAKSLSSITLADGDLFIEKLVQLPIPLAMPQVGSLAKLLDEIIIEAVGRDLTTNDEITVWNQMIEAGILSLFKTPRHVVRFGNALHATYRLIKSEVFLPDYIGMEVLKTANPEAYEFVRENKESLVGAPEKYGFFGMPQDEAKKLHTKWMETQSDKMPRAVFELLKVLFPRFKDSTDGLVSDRYDPSWDRLARICSTDHFNTYFLLQVAADRISREEIAKVLSPAFSQSVFLTYLQELHNRLMPNGSTYAAAFLDEAVTMFDDPELKFDPERLLKAIGVTTDSLLTPKDDGTGFFMQGNRDRIQRFVYHALKRVTPSDKFRILLDLMNKVNNIDFVVTCGVVYEPELHPRRSSQSELSAEQFGELKKSAVSRIEESSRDSRLENSKNLLFNLYRWLQWTDGDNTREWVKQLIKTDEGFKKLLLSFAGNVYSSSAGKTTVTRRIHPKTVSDFMDVEEVRSRVHSLLNSGNVAQDDLQVLQNLAKHLEKPSVDPDLDFDHEE